MSTKKNCYCGRPSIPGLKPGAAVCQYHYNVGQFGKEWADKCQDAMRFILWDPKDNYRPMTDEDGNKIISDGILGRVAHNNVYLTSYAEYPDNKRPVDLKIGQHIKGVHYRLSGEHGIYDIYRVENAGDLT